MLAGLGLLLVVLAPAAPYFPSPAHAASATPRALRPGSPPTSDRLLEEMGQPASPALQVLQQQVYFRDGMAGTTSFPVIGGGSGILVDMDSNRILWAGNEHVRRAPASTTKMMTALVALQNFPLDQQVLVSANAAGRDIVETRMGLLTGERLTVRELLSGMLTVSANDAAVAMADGTVGMDDYVTAMNRQVTALGLEDTHFTNPVGYPDEPQEFSTAYDLAAIATAGYRNYPLFRELTASHDVYLPATATHQEYKLHNINHLLDIYPAAVGTKSGFTDDAGPCLVSMAVRNGHHLVAVLMGAPRMFDQSRTLLEWGFVHDGLPPLYPSPSPSASAARR